MNLLESLKQTQTQRAEQPIPGQAANLRKMLAAKSGKAGAATGPAQSSVQENQALADFSTQATAQQQAAQADVTAQGLAQQAQQTQYVQGIQKLDQNQAQMQQQYRQNVQKIANDLSRLGDDIGSKEGRAKLNAALFARRLADKKYTTVLEREGKTRRLSDRQAFELEAGKQAFNNWNELFADEQDFANMLRMDDAEFKKRMAKMSIDSAKSILAGNMEAANKQAKWSAGADFVTTVGKGAITEYDSDKTDAQGKPVKTTFFEEMS